MAEFRMPSLGADMEHGTLVEWLVKPGDRVKRGDIVAVVDTEKGAIEIEVFQDGVVGALKVEVGARVPVGAVLALIGGEGEAKAAPPITPAPEPVSTPPPVSQPTPAPIPQLSTEATPRAAPGQKVSPYARRRASELGVALVDITGTGPGGAITARDVETRAPAPEGRPSAKPGLDRDEMRRAIARAMARSKREIPHFYVAHTMDVGALTDWLTRYNAARPPAARLLPVVPLMKAVALTLRAVPSLNGWYQDGQFEPSEVVHLGVAVALRGGGLIAPAIRNVDQLDLDALMNALRDLVQRVRSGRLRSSEMTDATVTITSLGEDQADTVFPIVYPPQVAIVGIGGIVERPWSVAGTVLSRPTLTVTVAADHRVSDGRIASRFLALLAESLNKPDML